MSLILFACAALALLLMPGPTNLLLVAASERDGLARSLRLLPLVILAYALGVAAVRLAIRLAPDLPLAFAFRIAAAAWLAALAVRIWLRPELARGRAGSGAALFVTTLTNPKVVVFATLLLPARPSPAAVGLLAPLIAASGLFYLLVGAGLVRLGLSQRVLWRALAALLLGFAGVAVAA